MRLYFGPRPAVCDPRLGSAPEAASKSRFGRVAAATAGALIATAFAFALPTAAQAAGNTSGFLGHLNSLRATHGLAPLTLTADLSAVAQAHSQQMASTGNLFHNPALTSQVTNWQTVGENVGMGPSVSAIDAAFDASPEHFANETNRSYTQVGIGSVTRADGEIFVTLDFRKPLTASTTPTKATTKAVTPATTTTRQATTKTTTKAAAPTAATTTARPTTTQPAPLSPQLLHGTDPLARAIVFADRMSTGQLR